MVFVRTAPVELPRVSDVTLDGHVLGFAAAVSLAAALLIAVLPAWRVAGRDVQAALRAGGNAATSDRGGTRMRATLLALQVGLSVTLIVVTALLGISFVRLTSIDRGFIAERVIAVNVALPATRYAEEPVRRSAYDRMLAGIRALPGIEAVTTTSLVPLSGDAQVNFIVADGDSRPRSDHATANFRFIAPDFFRTLGITVLRGRSFADTERDPHRPAPALISERTAARLWPGEDPIGKRFSRGIAEEQGFEIVGVVPDARTTSIERTPPLMVYAPYWWRSRPSTALLIKSAIDPASLMTGVRRAISGIDPEIALGQSRPLDEIVNQSLAARRYQLRLFLAFGLAALSTAIIGVYSVTAYGVSRRRREMHIRVALGARPSQAVSLIVRQASLAILAGIIAGGLAALALGRVVSSLLFDVGAHDPLVLCSVVAVVGGVGLLTSFGAARRGLTANSFAAFREE
jgi:predicted permease